jgi:hypothetical protein
MERTARGVDLNIKGNLLSRVSVLTKIDKRSAKKAPLPPVRQYRTASQAQRTKTLREVKDAIKRANTSAKKSRSSKLSLNFRK